MYQGDNIVAGFFGYRFPISLVYKEYTSTTLTLSLYESNRYLLADNGVAINKLYTQQSNTYINPTTNESAPKPPNKPIPCPKPTFKPLTNTHATKNSLKPTAKSTSQQSTRQHSSHPKIPEHPPRFKVESGSEGARISVGYQSEVYSSMRTGINKESLVTTDRKSTFSIEVSPVHAPPIASAQPYR